MQSNSDKSARHVDSDTTSVCCISSMPTDDDNDEDEDEGAVRPSSTMLCREDDDGAVAGATLKLSISLSCSPSNEQNSHTVAAMKKMRFFSFLRTDRSQQHSTKQTKNKKSVFFWGDRSIFRLSKQLNRGTPRFLLALFPSPSNPYPNPSASQQWINLLSLNALSLSPSTVL